MGGSGYFWWLSMRLLVATVASPFALVSVALLGATAFAFGLQKATARLQRKSLLVWFGAQVLMLPATILIGAFGEYSERPPQDVLFPTASVALLAIWFLSVSVGVYGICRFRGARWVATGAFLSVQSLLIWAQFIAGMSVSGDWL